MHLTSFDIGVFIVIAFSVALGFARRLSGELFNILAWVLAIGCTFSFAGWLATTRLFQEGVLGELLISNWVRHATSALLVFFLTYLGTRFSLRQLRLYLQKEGREDVGGSNTFFIWDKSLGAFYGFVRGLIFCSLIYWMVIWVTPSPTAWPDWMVASRTRPILALGQSYLETGATRVRETVLMQHIFVRYTDRFNEEGGSGDAASPMDGRAQAKG